MASKKPRRIWSILAGMLNTVSYVVLIIGLSLIISTFAILVANDVLALVKDGGELTVEADVADGKVTKLILGGHVTCVDEGQFEVEEKVFHLKHD